MHLQCSSHFWTGQFHQLVIGWCLFSSPFSLTHTLGYGSAPSLVLIGSNQYDYDFLLYCEQKNLMKTMKKEQRLLYFWRRLNFLTCPHVCNRITITTSLSGAVSGWRVAAAGRLTAGYGSSASATAFERLLDSLAMSWEMNVISEFLISTKWWIVFLYELQWIRESDQDQSQEKETDQKGDNAHVSAGTLFPTLFQLELRGAQAIKIHNPNASGCYQLHMASNVCEHYIKIFFWYSLIRDRV